MKLKFEMKVIARFIKSWGRDLAIVLSIMIPFRSSIADWNHVPTGSMKPTILECERVFVNKLAYDLKVPLTTLHLAEWGNPKRGDIVVFYSPTDGKRLVKRVIGVPGDTVEMMDNRLVVNGRPAVYSRLDKRHMTDISHAERSCSLFAWEEVGETGHPVMAEPESPAIRSFGPITVSEEKYLMLGDNRDNSADSRFFGLVERNAIVGKVPMVVTSFDRGNFYCPRPKRWFKSLP